VRFHTNAFLSSRSTSKLSKTTTKPLPPSVYWSPHKKPSRSSLRSSPTHGTFSPSRSTPKFSNFLTFFAKFPLYPYPCQRPWPHQRLTKGWQLCGVGKVFFSYYKRTTNMFKNPSPNS